MEQADGVTVEESEPFSVLTFMGRQTPAGQLFGGLLAGAGWGAAQAIIEIDHEVHRYLVVGGLSLAFAIWLAWLLHPTWRKWLGTITKALVVAWIVVVLAAAIMTILVIAGRVPSSQPTGRLVFGLVCLAATLLPSIWVLRSPQVDYNARTRRAAAKTRYFFVGRTDNEPLISIQRQLSEIAEQLNHLQSQAPSERRRGLKWWRWAGD